MPIDPETLRPLRSRGLRLGDWGSGPVFSPDRRYAAFGGQFGQVIVADLRRMRVLPELRFGEGYVFPVGWPRADLIVVTTCLPAGKDCHSPRLVLIDPGARRVRRTLRLAGPPVWGYDRVSGRSAILVQARAGRIGPAKLLVVEPSGAVRSTTLARIRIGNERRGLWQHYRRADLVVERRLDRALVIGAEEAVAEVSLRTLAVRYRPVPELALAPGALDRAPLQLWHGTANPSSEVAREARMLWPRAVSVSGRTRKLQRDETFREASLRPIILDTRTWRARRTVLAWGEYSAGLVFVGGGDPLVRAYGRDGNLRYQVRSPDPEWHATWQVFADRLYIGLADGRTVRVHDARTGRLLRRIRPTDVRPAFSWTGS